MPLRRRVKIRPASEASSRTNPGIVPRKPMHQAMYAESPFQKALKLTARQPKKGE
jgi:hypothetical protein